MMFLESYQKEYRRICDGIDTCQEPSLAQLEHEVRKTRPYGTMQRLMFMKTITWLIWEKGRDSRTTSSLIYITLLVDQNQSVDP